MAKKRKTNKLIKKILLNLIWLIPFLIVIGLIIYAGTHSWFQFVINVPMQNQTLSMTPNTQTPVYNSCIQVCSSNGFSQSYSFINSCRDRESKITYGYAGQTPLLICCCYNEQIQTPCIDSDGDDKDTVGHVTYDGNTYYDKCLDVGQGVTEYICEGGHAVAKKWACDLGEVCIQTRSGGHCVKSTPQYTCTDSDGKDNFDIWGNCQDNYHNLGFADHCEGYTAIDYYCDSNGICQTTTKGCRFPLEICVDGMCKVMACNQIIPAVPDNCVGGRCDTGGSCTFVPATTYSPARCTCA